MKRSFPFIFFGILFFCVAAAWGQGGVQTITVNGQTVALVYSTGSGTVSRIDLLYSAIITDYGNASTVGSIAWALGQSPTGTIHLGAGTFPVATPITVSIPVAIQGEAPASTIIQAASAIGAANFITVSSGNVSFFGLTIDGNGSGSAAISVSSGLSGFKFTNVTIENAAADGLDMVASSSVIIDKSTFIANGGCQFSFSTPDSTSTTGLQISNSTFSDSGSGPNRFVALIIGTYGTNSSINDVQLINNIVDYTGNGSTETDGIVVSTGGTSGSTINNVTLTGNKIGMSGSSIAGNSIELWSVTNFALSGNALNMANIGILVEGSSTGAINGNNIAKTMNGGIGISVHSSNCVISGNKLDNINGYGIVTTGSFDEVTDNQIVLGSVASTFGIFIACDTSPCINLLVANNLINGNNNGNAWGIASGGGTNKNVVMEGNRISGVGYAFVLQDTSYSGSQVVNNTLNLVYMGTYNKYTSFPAAGVLLIDDVTPLTFANLPVPVPAAGSRLYCTDCMTAATCLSGGTGHMAVSNGTAWACR